MESDEGDQIEPGEGDCSSLRVYEFRENCLLVGLSSLSLSRTTECL